MYGRSALWLVALQHHVLCHLLSSAYVCPPLYVACKWHIGVRVLIICQYLHISLQLLVVTVQCIDMILFLFSG
jgi:hypothetical protein